jgi:hypothetical protein
LWAQKKVVETQIKEQQKTRDAVGKMLGVERKAIIFCPSKSISNLQFI